MNQPLLTTTPIQSIDFLHKRPQISFRVHWHKGLTFPCKPILYDNLFFIWYLPLFISHLLYNFLFYCCLIIHFYMNFLRIWMIDEYNTYLAYSFTKFTDLFFILTVFFLCHIYVQINTSVQYIRQTHASNFIFTYVCA